MRKRILKSVPLAVLGLLVAAAAAWAVTWVPIYANDMHTNGLRNALPQVGKGACSRSGVAETLRVKVGKKTTQCVYSSTIVGSSGLSIVISGKLLSSTPDALLSRTFISVGLRVGDGGQFQLEVFPQRGTYKVIRDAPPNGKQTVISSKRSAKVKGVNLANKMRLDLVNAGKSSCRLTAYNNGAKLASFSDSSCNELSGRLSTFSVGSTKNDNGAAASFDNLKVSYPDPNG